MKNHTDDWPKIRTYTEEKYFAGEFPNGVEQIRVRRVRGKSRRPTIMRPTLRQVSVRLRRLRRAELAEKKFHRGSGSLASFKPSSRITNSRQQIETYIRSFAA